MDPETQIDLPTTTAGKLATHKEIHAGNKMDKAAKLVKVEVLNTAVIRTLKNCPYIFVDSSSSKFSKFMKAKFSPVSVHVSSEGSFFMFQDDQKGRKKAFYCYDSLDKQNKSKKLHCGKDLRIKLVNCEKNRPTKRSGVGLKAQQATEVETQSTVENTPQTSATTPANAMVEEENQSSINRTAHISEASSQRQLNASASEESQNRTEGSLQGPDTSGLGLLAATRPMESKDDDSGNELHDEALLEISNSEEMNIDSPKPEIIDDGKTADTEMQIDEIDTPESEQSDDWATTISETGSEEVSPHDSEAGDPTDAEAENQDVDDQQDEIDNDRYGNDEDKEDEESDELNSDGYDNNKDEGDEESDDHQSEANDDSEDESGNGDTDTEESESEDGSEAATDSEPSAKDISSKKNESPSVATVADHSAKVAALEPVTKWREVIKHEKVPGQPPVRRRSWVEVPVENSTPNSYKHLLKILAQSKTPDKNPELVEAKQIEAHLEFPNASYICIPGSEMFPIRGDFFPVIKAFCADNNLPIPFRIRADKDNYFLIYQVMGFMDVDRWNRQVFEKVIADGLRINFKDPAVYQLCISFTPRPMTPKEVAFWNNLDEEAARDAENNSQTMPLILNTIARLGRVLNYHYLEPKARGRGYGATFTILDRNSTRITLSAIQTIFEKVLTVAPSISRKRRRADFEDVEPLAKKFRLSPLSALKERSSKEGKFPALNGVFYEGTFHGISYQILDVDQPILPNLNIYVVMNRTHDGFPPDYDPSRATREISNSRWRKLQNLRGDVEEICLQVDKYIGDNRRDVIGVKANDDRIYVSVRGINPSLGQLMLAGWDNPVASWGKQYNDRLFEWWLFNGPYPALPVAKFPESICMANLHYQSVMTRRDFGGGVPDCVSRKHGLICGC